MKKLCKEDAMRECPKFSRCNVNSCPLDETSSDFRNKLEGENKCSLPKSLRMKIAEIYKLEFGGLTRAERSAKERFARMDEKEQKKFITEGSVRLKKRKTRLSQDG